MKKGVGLFTIALLAGITNIALAKSPKLSLSKPIVADYQCVDGSKIKVAYYNLSDNSLSFVKFTLNGEAYTLPQVVSASGVRYTDLHRVEWHEKGDSALLTKDVTDEKSPSIECRAVSTPSRGKSK